MKTPFLYPIRNRLPAALFPRSLSAAFAAMLAFMAGPAVLAQEIETATVKGRVYNARTNTYINRAVVTVDDASIRTFTNNFGEFILTDVPLGDRQVRVEFTGLEATTQWVNVTAGENSTRDFILGTRRGDSDGEREGDDVIELEDFVVNASDSFRSFSDIAVHEERFSPNLRTVVSADAYGTIAQGNVGEFIKFVPGVAIDYGGTYSSGADATAISIRGFRPDQTTVTVDGVPISGAQPGSLTRAVSLDMLSINNASRVEVIKVPTPDQPNAGIGGSVNLISKSAFEYAKPTFTFRAYMAMNSEHLDIFSKTPGPMHERTYKAIPGFDFSYALPINDKIGFTFNFASANQFNSNITLKPDWRTWVEQIIPRYVTEDGEVLEDVFPDASRPILNNIGLTDSPRVSERLSGSVKMDFAPWTGNLITVNYQFSTFSSSDAGRRLEVGTGGSQSIFEQGPDYQISRDGTGKSEINLIALDREGETHSGYAKWTYIKGPWNVSLIGSASVSDGELVSVRNGHFSGLDLRMGGVHKTILSGIRDGVPENIEYFDEEGNALDPTVLSSYRVSGYDPLDLSASSLQLVAGDSFTRSENYSGKFDIQRDLDFLPFESMSFKVKTGVYWQEQSEEKTGRGSNYKYQYMGESGVELNLADFRDEYYVGVSPGFGFAPREWPDTSKMYQYFLENPSVFSDTNDEPVFNPDDLNANPEESVASNNWSSAFNQQKAITETSISHYVQVEGSFFNHRLTVVGGFRQSESKRTGYSPFTDNDGLMLRDPNTIVDGRFGVMDLPGGIGRWNVINPIPRDIALAYEAAGAVYSDGTPFRVADLQPQIWTGTRPPPPSYIPPLGTYLNGIFHGPVVRGTLLAKQLVQIPNYRINEKSKGKPSPMISGAFDLTEKWVLRTSWSRTYAAPSFEGEFGVLRNVRFRQPQLNNDGTVTPGTIEVGNPSLRPWVSDNYDVGVSFYTDSGGKFSLNAFYKDISDMHQTVETLKSDPEYLSLLGELGYGPDSTYARDEWRITTVVNVPDGGSQYGWEFDFQQDMSALGSWGRFFYVFASYSTKKRSVAETVQSADAQFGNTSADNFASGGININIARFSARINMTWANERILSSGNYVLLTDPRVKREGDKPETFTPVPFQIYRPAEIRIDLNLAYRLSDRYTLDFAARNITDTGRESIVRTLDGTLPDFASKGERSVYGVNFTVGISGRW